VLINADDGKFGYAGIFCGMTTLIGILIAVAPVGVDWFNRFILRKKDETDAAEKGVAEKAPEDAETTLPREEGTGRK
jgi:hypothetical protein